MRDIGYFYKIIKMMAMLFFLCTFSAFSKEKYSQESIVFVSLRVESGTIYSLFSEIEEKSDYVFLFSDDSDMELKNIISINAKNESIFKILDKALKETGLSYIVKNRQISVYKKGGELPVIPDMEIRQQPKIRISGIVKDTKGELLVGVNIRDKNQKTIGVTDNAGRYTVETDETSIALIFSYIGFLSQEITIGNKTVIDVLLKDDVYQLQEAIVIAYGTQSKITSTGALSMIGSKELTRVPVTSLTNTLAGLLPGASTIQTTGQPGRDAAQIFIRGSGSLSDGRSSPLIMVDGVERDFTQIDPNEIENITVLKDASSTAVFGVRGANGVILVTTKRGKIGEPSISVSSTFGIQQPISLITAAGSYDYARFWNIRQEMDGRTNIFRPEQVEAYRTGSDPIMYPDISWKDYMFHESFIQSNNNVNISGGTENIKYFVSLGYLYQNGLLKQFSSLPYDNNYRYNRYNYRGNIDANLTPTTNMKLDIGGYVSDVQEPKIIEDVPWAWTVAQVWAQPFAGPGLINGKRTMLTRGTLPTDELRDGLFTFYGYGYSREYETILNGDIELSQQLNFLTDGLSASLKGAYDNNFRISKERRGDVETQTVYYKSMLTDPSLPETDPHFDKTIVFTPVWRDVPLDYNESTGRGRKWYIEAKLNYKKDFGQHNVTGLLLYNQSRLYYPESYSYMPRGYIGWVGRATYNYKQRYLLDVNMGYNGSENFAPGKNRYGFFPAFSAGWVVSGENFMEKQKMADHLKLRFSIGRVGSDLDRQVYNSSRFMYMPGTWSTGGSYSFGINNPIGVETSYMGTPGNRNVTWETADKQNYGIDVTFLSNRLSFNFDYFTEKRTGILIAPNQMPIIIATSLPNLNIGAVNNKGYEVVIGWSDRINKLDYYVNTNISYSKNKIINIDEVPNLYDYQNVTGGPTGRQSGMYKFIRLYRYGDFDKGEDGEYILKKDLPQPYIQVYPGDAMYADLNDDGTVDADDRMVYGYSSRPEYVFGLNVGLQYEGVGLTMNWAGATHVAKMLEEDYRTPFTTAGSRGLIQYFVDDSWTPEHQDASLPRPAVTTRSWNTSKSTLWLQDASYLRLKTISLNYTMKNMKFLNTLKIKSLVINLSGYNLLTFTKLKALDPEGNTQNNGAYPIIKTYNLGATINF